MASQILIASPTPDGVPVRTNADFDVDCIQQVDQSEQGSVAHLQFSTTPPAQWHTCLADAGAVQCSPVPWVRVAASFSIPDVQLKILGQQTIRVAIGTDVDPDNPGLTGLVSDERIVNGIRAPIVAVAMDHTRTAGAEDRTSTGNVPARDATAGAEGRTAEASLPDRDADGGVVGG